MQPFELLNQLPTWKTATPEMIFQSEAWRITTTVQGQPYILRKRTEPLIEKLSLIITLDDNEYVLILNDSDAYPQLHHCWASRMDLPESILLALIENECSILFQAIENCLHRQLAIKRVLNEIPANLHAATTFQLIALDGTWEASFMLAITPDLMEELGHLKYLDPTDPLIQAIKLSVDVDIAAFSLPTEDLHALTPGDCLLLPEINKDNYLLEPKLIIANSFIVLKNTLFPWEADNLSHLQCDTSLAINFGDLCAGKFPDINQPVTAIKLTTAGSIQARGHLSTLCGQKCMSIEEVL